MLMKNVDGRVIVKACANSANSLLGCSFLGLYADDPYEVEANEFARDMLIPPAAWKAIMKVQPKSSYPAVVAKCIAEEAEKRGISKSIAISRYKHDSNVYNIKSYRSAKIQ